MVQKWEELTEEGSVETDLLKKIGEPKPDDISIKRAKKIIKKLSKEKENEEEAEEEAGAEPEPEEVE